MASSIKTALDEAGFKFIGYCSTCRGRGLEYRLEADKTGLQAKLKVDSTNTEMVVTFNGYFNGKRIINQIAVPGTIEQTLKAIGII